MSAFACTVERLTIKPHPNADAIELAQIGDYLSIVKKGQYQDGDLAVYIPEAAVIPEWLLKSMGFWDDFKQKGVLAGAEGNRVKAKKLRGIVSQGLVLGGEQVLLGFNSAVEIHNPEKQPDDSLFAREGQDVAEFLGIVKYQPSLPQHMQAKVAGVDWDNTHNYDFDNLKKKPTLFDDGEEVVITEKIHGTFIQVGVLPKNKANERYHEGRVLVSSKGLGAKGYVLDHNDPGNLYAQAAIRAGIFDKIMAVFGHIADATDRPLFICGEVFGRTMGGAGVQDLTYTDKELDFRAFDICVGNRGSEAYASWDTFVSMCRDLGVEHAPLLYRGPYSKEVVLQHTDGMTTLGGGKHIREGVVVKSAVEAQSQHFGRKIAKSISDAYLLRKNENATEFQ